MTEFTRPTPISPKVWDLPTRLLTRPSRPSTVILAVLGLGICFLLVAAATGVGRAAGKEQIAYFANFSWSSTMVTLFPLAFGCIALFYQRLPSVMAQLTDSLEIPPGALEARIVPLLTQRKLNVIYLIVPPMMLIYLVGLQDSPTWLWRNFAPPGKIDGSVLGHLTLLGYLTLPCLIFLGTALLFLVRAALFAHAIRRHLEANHCRLSPFHPDGMYGLESLRSLLGLVAWVMCLYGFYVVAYLTDKIALQKDWAGSWPIMAVYIFTWLALAIVYYSAILLPFRSMMLVAKHEALKPLTNYLEQGSAGESPLLPSEAMQHAQVHQCYLQLRQKYPEWLLAIRSKPAAVLQGSPVALSLGLQIYKLFEDLGLSW